MRNQKTCEELLMKLGLRLKIEATYTRGGEKKKPGHGEKAKEQWMKCALRMCTEKFRPRNTDKVINPVRFCIHTLAFGVLKIANKGSRTSILSCSTVVNNSILSVSYCDLTVNN